MLSERCYRPKLLRTPPAAAWAEPMKLPATASFPAEIAKGIPFLTTLDATTAEIASDLREGWVGSGERSIVLCVKQTKL